MHSSSTKEGLALDKKLLLSPWPLPVRGPLPLSNSPVGDISSEHLTLAYCTGIRIVSSAIRVNHRLSNTSYFQTFFSTTTAQSI